MKYSTFVVAAMISAQTFLAACQPDGPVDHKPKSVVPANKVDSISYAIGRVVGTKLREDGVEMNVKMVVAALQDAYKGETVLSRTQADSILMEFAQSMRDKHNNAPQEQSPEVQGNSAQVKAEGEKFLAENKSKPGVITTPSGLQYKVEKMGNGPKPTASSSVKVHYHGTLTNGQVFDSSVDRKEPINLEVGKVIPGWQEALLMMPVGSRFIIYVPSNLAYGERGAGAIPPNSALVFEIQLLDILK